MPVIVGIDDSNKRIRRYYAYCRLSADDKRSMSIEAQKERIQEFAKINNIRIRKWFIDRGYSGGTIERPAMLRLLEILRPRDCVIVYAFDRLGRGNALLDALNKIYFEKKAYVISIRERLDWSNPEDQIVIKQLAFLSGTELDLVKLRMYSILKAGRWCFRPPYGYRMSESEKGVLVPVREELKNVKEIFQKYLNTRKGALKRIAKEYKLTPAKVWRILRNPIYCGYLYTRMFGQLLLFPAELPRIVSIETWMKVQKKLEKRRKKKVKYPQKYVI